MAFPTMSPRSVRHARSQYPRWMRRAALAMAGVFVWTGALFPTAAAIASPSHTSIDPGQRPLSQQEMQQMRGKERQPAPAKSSQESSKTPITLLNSAGQLAHNLPDRLDAQWRYVLHTHLAQPLTAERRAMLTLWLGEYEMAHNNEPEKADFYFRSVTQMTSVHSPYHGIAGFDHALSLFFQGRYPQSQSTFSQLIHHKPALGGYNSSVATLWQRHASACAGYHAERAAAGITEPNHLDPLCGAEALAACLRAQHRPYDKHTVLGACRVTGRGSNLQEVLDAATKLGMSARPVAVTTDAGLISLPKPLVAFVEHDHFVALTRADKQGVSYLCSDCGAWPGGQINLSWKQWHKMEAGIFGSVVVPGSPDQIWLDKTLGAVKKTGSALSEQALTSSSSATCQLLLGGGGGNGSGGNGVNNPGNGSDTYYCGDMPTGPLVCACPPTDKPGPKAASAGGPTANDPVNLASLQEEYGPDQDLFVYNPIGPSVDWSRTYQSLRGKDDDYENDDFGLGWSHTYNCGIYDPNVIREPLVPVTITTTLTLTGTDLPATDPDWDITLNGSIVASYLNPNGWTVTGAFQGQWGTNGNFNITAPASAALSSNYELRTHPAYVGNTSTFFDVVTVNTGEPGGTVNVPVTGTDSPASGSGWDILLGGSIIATSASPHGWNVNLAVNAFTGPHLNVIISGAASAGNNYEVRAVGSSACGAESGYFNVVIPPAFPQTGTKYIFLQKGERISFTAPAVPTAANPNVACTVQAGRGFLVTWNYSGTNPLGYYTVTNASRSTWVTGTAARFITYADDVLLPPNFCGAVFQVHQVSDNLGHSIFLNYGAPGTGGFPLLASITDANNLALLTFNRAMDGTGNLLSIMDRYNRSVYYHVGTYATSNVPSNYSQSQQELDHVSQVGNGADRVVYGYQGFGNGEGAELIPYLHTITVPSPTGTGTATAVLNYTSAGLVSNIVDANLNVSTYTQVDANHTKVTIKDQYGNLAYSYTVGFDSNMDSTTVTDGTNGNSLVTNVYGDPNDPYKPSSVTDADGHTFEFTWDQHGNNLTTTTPRNTTTTNTYSYANFALGELVQTQETGKSPTSFSYYEPGGKPQAITTPLPGTNNSNQTVTSSFTYDALGNILTVTEPGNNASASITRTYNYTSDGTYTQPAAIGQALTVTNNLGKISHARYDVQGRVVTTLDEIGNEYDYTYDLIGDPLQITGPATGQTGPGRGYGLNSYLYMGGPLTQTTVYDESGNPAQSVVPVYGKEGETLTKTGNVLSVTQAFDAAYRLISLKDGNNHTTTYSYNQAGYVSGVVYPGGDTVQIPNYDPTGRRLKRIDGRGVETDYLYNDPVGQLTAVQFPATPALNESFSYDAYGNLASRSDSTGAKSYLHDDHDTMTSVTTTYTNLPALSVSCTFYPDGSIQNLSTPAGSFSYTYDAEGGNSSMTNPFGESFSWSYLDNGWLSTQTLGTAATTYYSLNSAGQLTDLAHRNGAGTLLSDFGGQSYDAVGKLTGITANLPGIGTYGGQTSFQYDSKNELTQEQSQRLGGYTNVFGYDAVGNLTNFKGAANSFNSDNQNTADTFDLNGNPTSYRGTNLSFDAHNHVSSFGSLLTAGYDADGLRAWKQNAAGTRTYYLYAGDVPICELDNQGNVTATNTWGSTGLMARRPAGTGGSVFYTFDMQGNAAQRLDSGGNVLSSHTFDSFGAESSSAPVTDPYAGFGAQWGYYTDSETGLELLGHRYYDTSRGRFINRDPIEYRGGINLYAYTGNNPIGSTDPSGLAFGRPGGDIGGGGWGGGAGIGDISGSAADNNAIGAAIDRIGDSWSKALNYLGDFLSGSGSNDRHYGPETQECQDMMASGGMVMVRNSIDNPNDHGGHHKGGISTGSAFKRTIVNLGNGTQAEVGGFDWYADRRGHKMHYRIVNKTDFNSFLYHIPGGLNCLMDAFAWKSDGKAGVDYTGVPTGWNSGPMRTIIQTFEWDEDIPQEYW